MSPTSSDPSAFSAAETSQLGARIARLREARGWKQRELARRATLSPDRLSRLERGISAATVVELARLSAVLEISCDELLFGPGQSLSKAWGATALEDLDDPADAAFFTRLLHLVGLGLRAESAAPRAADPSPLTRRRP